MRPPNLYLVGHLRTQLGGELDRFLQIFPPQVGIRGRLKRTKDGLSQKTAWRYASKNGELIVLEAPHIERAFASGPTLEAVDYIGLRFGERTRYGLIDLDWDSPHRTPEALRCLVDAADDLDLILVPCQSSYSGGWHLYLFAEDFIPSSDMSRLLKGIARKAGLETLRKGSCEVYPDTADLNQAVRLPGQAGFGFIDPSTGIPEDVFDASTPADNIRRLLHVIDHQANEVEVIKEALARIPDEDRHLRQQVDPLKPAKQGKRRGRPPKKKKVVSLRPQLPATEDLSLDRLLVARHDLNAAREGRPGFFSPENPYGIHQYKRGEELYRTGLQARGTRHEALMAVNFYLLFSGHRNLEERAVVLERWIRTKHNDQSKEWTTCPQAVLEDIKRLTQWTRRKTDSEAPGDQPIDFWQARNLRIKKANRRRIEEAHDRLIEEGVQPTYNRIQSLTGFARKTIANHRKEIGEAWGQGPLKQPTRGRPPAIGVDSNPKTSNQADQRQRKFSDGIAPQPSVACSPFGGVPISLLEARARRLIDHQEEARGNEKLVYPPLEEVGGGQIPLPCIRKAVRA